MKKGLKNLIVALICQFVGIIAAFFTRKIFLSQLGSEYLGIDALFANIISFLSLAELGVGQSMAFALYKPIVENNKEAIKAYTSLYKRVYSAIGVVVLILGLALLPIYRLFINGENHVNNLDLIFVIFVINCAFSYFMSYKRTLIISDEKKYITTIIRYSCYVLMNIAQIAILLLAKNYYLFLIVQTFFTIVENYAVNMSANKMYPFLKEKNVRKLERKEVKDFKQNVSAMFVHKVGGMVVNSTDNLLISRMVNVVNVGINANYVMLTNALTTITNQFFEAVIASIGKIGAKEDEDKLIKTFYRAFFFNFILFGFISCTLMTVLNSFITIWVGESYVFSLPITALIVFNFYLRGMRKTCIMYRDALGLFWHDRYKPIIESVLNLVVSIVLGMTMGVLGIFIGTTISTILVPLWVEPYILYKHRFKKGLNIYFLKFAGYTTVTVLASVASVFISVAIKINIPIISLFVKAIISMTVFMVFSILVYRKSSELNYYIGIIKKGRNEIAKR